MQELFAGLLPTVERARVAWLDGGGVSVAGMAAGPLVAVNDALGMLARQVDAIRTQVAAEIARQSRVEYGRDGLARVHGFRSAPVMIAATTGMTTGDAARLVTVGDATTPRTTLLGDIAVPRHPHVAAALAAGTLGVPAASVIVTRLDAVALRAEPGAVDQAEQVLVARAPGLTLDQLTGILARIEAHLDPDGVAPKEDQLRTDRSLRVREEPSGMIVLTARLDPENGAYVKAAIDAIVTAELRHRTERDHVSPPVAGESRSISQRQADALVDLCRHTLGCTNAGFGNATTTVVVRINLAELETATGVGTIDGIATPVTAGTVRRMAAQGNIIACVLGADSDILDWGRAKRLFTPAQRLALLERDGGCAFCGADPTHTEAHHLKWWARDGGSTNLSNGVMLCTRCHHRIHNDGWTIHIDGTATTATVWFTPPPWLDPNQTPRPGGRARYGLTA